MLIFGKVCLYRMVFMYDVEFLLHSSRNSKTHLIACLSIIAAVTAVYIHWLRSQRSVRAEAVYPWQGWKQRGAEETKSNKKTELWRDIERKLCYSQSHTIWPKCGNHVVIYRFTQKLWTTKKRTNKQEKSKLTGKQTPSCPYRKTTQQRLWCSISKFSIYTYLQVSRLQPEAV